MVKPTLNRAELEAQQTTAVPPARRPVLPDGWWDGPATGEQAHWRERALRAERELEELRRSTGSKGGT